MAIDHAITVPSLSGVPSPSGTLADPESPGPSEENVLTCPYACTVSQHTDTVIVIWNGTSFSLPDDEANDPNFGAIAITYDPPI